MCARITITTTGTEIADLFGLSYDMSHPKPVSKARYNVAPSTLIPVMRTVNGQRELADLRWGRHNWDVINWACRGLPVRAMGLGRTGLYKAFQPDRDVHDYYSAVVEYENGVLVNILHSWVAPGQNGKFTQAFNDEYTRLNGVKAGIDFNTGVIAYRKELNIPDKVGHSAKGAINNTKLGLEAFAASVKDRKPPVATVEHGRDAVLACLLVREAVYQKKPVTMKELKG